MCQKCQKKSETWILIFHFLLNEQPHIEFLSKMIAQLFSYYFLIQLVSNEFRIFKNFISFN